MFEIKRKNPGTDVARLACLTYYLPATKITKTRSIPRGSDSLKLSNVIGDADESLVGVQPLGCLGFRPRNNGRRIEIRRGTRAEAHATKTFHRVTTRPYALVSPRVTTTFELNSSDTQSAESLKKTDIAVLTCMIQDLLLDIIDFQRHRFGRSIMTETAARLLATFESLPPQEKHELLTEMLRRSGELLETFLSDNDFVSLADALFQTLDAEELDDASSGAK